MFLCSRLVHDGNVEQQLNVCKWKIIAGFRTQKCELVVELGRIGLEFFRRLVTRRLSNSDDFVGFILPERLMLFEPVFLSTNSQITLIRSEQGFADKWKTLKSFHSWFQTNWATFPNSRERAAVVFTWVWLTTGCLKIVPNTHQRTPLLRGLSLFCFYIIINILFNRQVCVRWIGT